MFVKSRSAPLSCFPVPVSRPLPRLALVLMLAWCGLTLHTRGAEQALVHNYSEGAAALKGAVTAIVETAEHTLLVGSNVLSEFDGRKWTEIPVPGGYAFRGLARALESPRIYVGGIGALGYVERAGGEWQFHSLTRALAEAGLKLPEDIWSVHAIRGGAVWLGTREVLRWDGVRFDGWTLAGNQPLAGWTVNDGLNLYQDNVGILKLTESGPPQLLIAARDLPVTPVTWCVPPTDERDGREGAAFFGLGDAAFRWEGGKFTRLDELSRALRGSFPSNAVRLDRERIAIGTFKAGVVLATTTGRVLGAITPQQGLADDSVHSLCRAAGLWIGLEGTLAWVESPGEAGAFLRNEGALRGVPRMVVEVNGREFLLASKSLARRESDGSVTAVFGDAPLLWDATEAGEQLWIGGFGGLWTITGDGARAEHVHHVSTDVLQVKSTRRLAGGVVFLEGYALKGMQRGASGWVPRDLGQIVPDTPVSLRESEDGDIWVSTRRAGVFRFNWVERKRLGTDDLETIPQLALKGVYQFSEGAPNPILIQAGPKMFAFTTTSIWEFDTAAHRFAPAPQWEDFIGLAGAWSGVEGWWLVRPRMLATLGTQALIHVSLQGDTLQWTPLSCPGLESLGSPNGIFLTQHSSHLWITGAAQILRFDTAALSAAPAPGAASLRAVRLNGDPADHREAELSPGVQRLAFEFAGMGTNADRVFFQTRLEGVDHDWSAPTSDTTRLFGGLAPGSYAFRVRTVDAFGRTSSPFIHRFVVRPRWFETPWAYAALVLLIAGFGGLVARWQVRRLRRQNEKLNRLVAERTRELELSNTAKSEFLENVSHELRNPLNGLTGLLGQLNEARMAPEERERAKSLRAVAGTLTRVFEDVLEFSKLEYGYATLRKTTFSLHALLDEIVDLFSVPARAAGCELRVAWPPDLRDGFSGDADKIRTVISNFVSNALKYAPGKPVVISVDAEEKTPETIDMFIEVMDQGPGLPAEEQELIFKKFVRGTEAKRKQVPGTGLGLATCRVLARLMNGSVNVESTPGSGATFSLRFLLPRAPLPDAPVTTPPPPDGEAALIVEDEPYNQAILQGIALGLGYAPFVAGDAAEAAMQLAARRFALIFLDWELPGAKGGDVARYVRAAPGGDRPIILATTAHDSDEMRERCSAAGMDGFLLKPYNPARVQRVLAAVHAERRGETAAAPRQDSPGGSPLNLEAFKHYARARPHEAQQAASRYRQALAAEIAALTQAVEAGGAEASAGCAHRVRALGGLICAAELTEAAAQLEERARRGELAECRDQMPRLRALAESLDAQVANASGR